MAKVPSESQPYSLMVQLQDDTLSNFMIMVWNAQFVDWWQDMKSRLPRPYRRGYHQLRNEITDRYWSAPVELTLGVLDTITVSGRNASLYSYTVNFHDAATAREAAAFVALPPLAITLPGADTPLHGGISVAEIQAALPAWQITTGDTMTTVGGSVIRASYARPASGSEDDNAVLFFVDGQLWRIMYSRPGAVAPAVVAWFDALTQALVEPERLRGPTDIAPDCDLWATDDGIYISAEEADTGSGPAYHVRAVEFVGF